MSKVAKVIGQVAAVVAFVAGVALLFVPGGQVFGVGLITISGVASAISAVAFAVSQATMKPPDMQGTINEVMIGNNMPVPYVMGRTFVGGMKVYDDSATNGKPNSDRSQIFVGSHAGPIDGFEKFLSDFSPITFATESGGLISGVATGFYGADGGYLWLNTRKGARPETALTSPAGRVAFTGFGSSHKLSGMAAWSATMEFDEDGKRWASGIPAFGMVAKWVKIYDPRKDSSYPGGSGSHDWDDESTWEFGSPGVGTVAVGENPALHALAYARGRFMGADNVKVVGAGIAKDAIDIPAFVELANICDANDWTIGGAVYEGPGISRWDNLKRILQAAAAEPAWVGGMLTCKISAPKIALYTLTADDLADGEIEVQAMSNWKDRFNTIIPRYRSEDHRWEYVQADAIVNATYVTEDGETKTEEIQFDLVQDKDQAAQLAAYTLANRREFGPIRLAAKPHLMAYRPGEAIEIDIPEAGLSSQLAIITGRSVDPSNGSVSLTLESETTAKHAYALGQTGVAPPTPTLIPSEDVDTATQEANITPTETQTILRMTYPQGLTMTGVDTGSNARIDLSTYNLRYTGPTGTVAMGTASITGLSYNTDYYPYADLDSLGDTTPTYGATTTLADAINSAAHPWRIYLNQKVHTPASGAGSTSGGGYGGGGYGGGGVIP